MKKLLSLIYGLALATGVFAQNVTAEKSNYSGDKNPAVVVLPDFSTPQAANSVWAGPASGSAAAPTFRLLLPADLLNVDNPSVIVAATVTLDGTYRDIQCDATAAPITITLPSATETGQQYIIEKRDATANACTITRSGSDTISGVTSVTLANRAEAVWLRDCQANKWCRGWSKYTLGVSNYLDVIDNTQGDILFRSSASWHALAVGTTGQRLEAVGASNDLIWSDPLPNPSKYAWFFDDFCGPTPTATANPWSLLANNTPGTLARVDGETNHPCMVKEVLGTTGNSQQALNLGASVMGPIMGGERFDFYFKVITLSDATNTYTLRIGLSDKSGSSTGGLADNGLQFIYTHGTNSGKWQFVARNNGAGAISSDSGTAVAGTTYYHAQIYCNTTASCHFYMGIGTGALAELAGSPLTSNIPVTAAGRFSPNFGFVQSAGAANVDVIYVDAFMMQYPITR